MHVSSRLALLYLVAACSNASQLAAQPTKPQVEEPLNQWSGSTLGLNGIGFAPKNFYVGQIRTGLAADRAGLKPYDRLFRIGEVDLLKQTKTDQQSYLD